MEKLLHILHIHFLTNLFARTKTEQASLNILWRIVLCSVLMAALVIGVFAYLTYRQVIAESASSLPQNQPTLISIEELRGVIDLYQKKEDNYKSLLQSSPQAPLLGVGSGR